MALKKIRELSKSTLKMEEKIIKEEKKIEPLMVFLSSSINAEIIYTILSGICQFTLLNFVRNEFTPEQFERFKAMDYRVVGGDTTITMRTTKIVDIKRWEKEGIDELLGQSDVSRDTTVTEGSAQDRDGSYVSESQLLSSPNAQDVTMDFGERRTTFDTEPRQRRSDEEALPSRQRSSSELEEEEV